MCADRVYLFTNTDRYEGDYANGKYHGHGQCFFANGDRYDGDWMFGKRSGYGRLVLANNEQYGTKCNVPFARLFNYNYYEMNTKELMYMCVV